MQIQVNTDKNVEGGQELSAWVSDEVRARLDRFSTHVTRIEIHLSDADGNKTGGSDKQCLIEARIEGRNPETASDQASTLEAAVSGASKKIQHVLETSLGRLNHVWGAQTIRTAEHD